MTFDRNTPFNDLPLLPPAGAELETLKVLKKTITASRALAELKGLGGTISNQAMLINTRLGHMCFICPRKLNIWT